jgi:hypothetical protein
MFVQSEEFIKSHGGKEMMFLFMDKKAIQLLGD